MLQVAVQGGGIRVDEFQRLRLLDGWSQRWGPDAKWWGATEILNHAVAVQCALTVAGLTVWAQKLTAIAKTLQCLA